MKLIIINLGFIIYVEVEYNSNTKGRTGKMGMCCAQLLDYCEQGIVFTEGRLW